MGYSSRKVLAVRVSRTRKTHDVRAVFDEAEKNTKMPITVVTADAWNGTQAMIKELNRPITFVIHKHKTPYDKAIIWEVEYISQERIVTKMGIKTDFFKRRGKQEYFWRVEREPRFIKRYSIRGRPKGVKNGHGKKPKYVRKNIPTGRKGLFTVFTKGKRGYAKIYPHRKRIKIGGKVPPAVTAAFGRTVELFSEKFVQNNLAENLNSVLSFHPFHPEVAKIAKEENFPELATQILAIATAEEHHEARYKMLLEQLEKASYFKKDGKVWWLCMECGYWHFAKEPPKMCPSCDHPQAFFKKMDEDY